MKPEPIRKCQENMAAKIGLYGAERERHLLDGRDVAATVAWARALAWKKAAEMLAQAIREAGE